MEKREAPRVRLGEDGQRSQLTRTLNVPGEGTLPVLTPPAALLDGLFEHPAGERIAYSSEQSGAWEIRGG